MRINNWMDVVFWTFAAGVVLFMLGTFLQILWQSFNLFSDRGVRRRPARSARGGLGGDSAGNPMFDATADSGSDTSVEIAGDVSGGDLGGSDSGGGDFSGGGGDYGGGGSGGSWS